MGSRAGDGIKLESISHPPTMSLPAEVSARVQQAAAALKKATALVITAGAGMGVDSGLPDFRGKQGFWKAYPPMKELNLDLPSMSNPMWFDRDPALAWGFFGHRLQLYTRTTPHAGFSMLLDLARQKPHGCFVFTSNVDGQFQTAGFDESQVVECHGSIHHMQCTAPHKCNGEPEIWPVTDDAKGLVVDPVTFRASEPLPKCLHGCGRLARPNILMFGDWSWVGRRTDAQYERFDEFLTDLVDKEAHVAVVELGAGLAVPTVRKTSEQVAKTVNVARGSGTLIRINPQDPEVPTLGASFISIPLPALQALNEIFSAMG